MRWPVQPGAVRRCLGLEQRQERAEEHGTQMDEHCKQLQQPPRPHRQSLKNASVSAIKCSGPGTGLSVMTDCSQTWLGATDVHGQECEARYCRARGKVEQASDTNKTKVSLPSPLLSHVVSLLPALRHQFEWSPVPGGHGVGIGAAKLAQSKLRLSTARAD